MSDEGPDDMLPSTSRDRLDGSGHRLEFMIGDQVLPYDMTVYQAVQQFGSTPMFDMTSGENDPENRNSPIMYGSPGIWARIHTIYYRPVLASGSGLSSDGLNANLSGTYLVFLKNNSNMKTFGGIDNNIFSNRNYQQKRPKRIWQRFK